MNIANELRALADKWRGKRNYEFACCADELSALADRLCEGWQPIETAPKNDIHVLLFDRGVVWLGYFAWHHKLWVDGAERILEPTHWQPLPEPPHDR